ncbi:MAG: roadblock/LC7 domain-containing protein [Candidatus Thorarchaeota archaeon]|nr:roadblock/LC7 domain-containing protein [Candidatus Thorarchaeota archaeon]
MSSKTRKLVDILNQLVTSSEIDGAALVSSKGQLMASVLQKDVDEKAIAAMAAALTSIGTRVGMTLKGGEPKNIVIEGISKIILVRTLDKASVIATAPADSKIGMLDFELGKVLKEISSVL